MSSWVQINSGGLPYSIDAICFFVRTRTFQLNERIEWHMVRATVLCFASLFVLCNEFSTVEMHIYLLPQHICAGDSLTYANRRRRSIDSFPFQDFDLTPIDDSHCEKLCSTKIAVCRFFHIRCFWKLVQKKTHTHTHIYINSREKNANHLILSHKKAGNKNRLISKYCGSIINFSDRAHDQACTFQNDRFWIEQTASQPAGCLASMRKRTKPQQFDNCHRQLVFNRMKVNKNYGQAII